MDEEVKECAICMETIEKAMKYRCCKQTVCKPCYKTMHRQNNRKECPFCRHTPIRGLYTPLSGSIKKMHRNPSDVTFLLDKRALMPIIRDILEREGEGLTIDRGAIIVLRQAVEEYGIDRMRNAQHFADFNKNNTVMHL